VRATLEHNGLGRSQLPAELTSPDSPLRSPDLPKGDRIVLARVDLGTGVFPDAPRVAAEQAQAVVTVASVRAGDRYWRPLDGYIHATDGRVTGWSSFGLPFQRADVAPDLDRMFQAHELDRLVGPYPEAAATYRARSPLHAVDRITRPVLLVHGLEDTVVPPSQAQVMAEALARRGVRHVLLTFPGEGHGFRRPGASGVRSRLSCPSTLKR
jgi:pimeloyl-ACP methyl ester carboxylesterase